ncbi:MAG: VCBS repeat-containing protein [Bacteroidota bacterium]
MRLIGLVVIIFTLTISCTTEEQKQELLARQYCGTCHSLPEPSLLDKSSWRDVMPQMAVRMGITIGPLMSLSEADYPYVIATLPKSPIISEHDYNLIAAYYEREAPDSLTLLPDFETKDLDQFEVTPLKLLKRRPTLCMVKADTINKQLWLSNRDLMLYKYSYDFKKLDSMKMPSPVSSKADSLITLMGVMDPNDQPRGSVVTLQKQTLVDSLKRPADLQYEDLNNDGKKDLVVCAFGNYAGQLLVFQKLGDGSFSKHVIASLPGARRTVVRDFNNDGLKDILVMFSQGDEQISLYTNAGNFRFRVTTLLKFPAVYGSSYFDIVDFNKDGHWDIIYTNGDNADYSKILKPYHGVRVFLNDGKNHFEESWFQNLYGCSIAIGRDFDKDGDIDIATISFFPDFKKHPERTFVYFENNNGKMESYTTPLSADGRWLVMEPVDLDADGYTDIVLGALDFDDQITESVRTHWEENPVDVLVLRNLGKK